MDDLSAAVYLALSGRRRTQNEYPCTWCGILTTILDAEDFHVCPEHQREYATTDYAVMREKYPLAGKDERNPAFFRARHERLVSRARSLSIRELRLILKRGMGADRDHAQIILDRGTLSPNGMEFLGGSAEQYVDTWL